MSLVILVKTDKETIVGAERSLTCMDYNYSIRITDKGTKIKQREEDGGIIGGVGPAVYVDGLIEEVLAYEDDIDDLLNNKPRLKTWFKEKLEKIRDDIGFKDDDNDFINFHIIIASKNHVALIDGFGFIAMLDEPYYAIGTGGDMAMGIMRYALEGNTKNAIVSGISKEKIANIIKNANDCVSSYCGSVGHSDRGYDVCVIEKTKENNNGKSK